jgi:methionyl-tRNA formyltransferase
MGPAPLRVAFLGNAAWSVPSLERLAEGRHDVALVLTRDARPAGRGHRPRRTPVAVEAERLGLELMETPTVRVGDGFGRLQESAPDVLVVVAYGEILPARVLGLARVMPVNLHFSLLPRWRGAAPVQRAILAGDEGTGVSTMRMTEGLDEGPVLLQAPTAIGPEENAGSLGARLAALGAELLAETLDTLAAGTLEERPQDEALASFAPRLKPDERRIDWSAPAEEVVRRVRAFAPKPGATTVFRGRSLKVLRARATEDAPGGGAGRVAVASKRDLVVRAGAGAVELLEVAPEGRGRMSGADLVRGDGPEPGEILG